jgi:hypothetical protein
MKKTPLPPRLATQLVALFAPESQRAIITGDLFEEFVERASKSSGQPVLWYWREAVRTSMHLLLNQLRNAPVALAIQVVASLIALSLAQTLTYKAAGAVLQVYGDQIYSHISAPTFWFFYSTLLGCVAEPLLIAWTAASFGRGREMGLGLVTATILMSMNMRWTIFILLWVAKHGYLPKWQVSLPELLIPPVAILFGVLLRLKSARPVELGHKEVV